MLVFQALRLYAPLVLLLMRVYLGYLRLETVAVVRHLHQVLAKNGVLRVPHGLGQNLLILKGGVIKKFQQLL